MNELTPLFVDLTDVSVIVFGGGNVALRKCKFLNSSKITVVSSSVIPELEDLVEYVVISTVSGEDIGAMIEGHEMVIAATDDKGLNDRIREVSIAKGIPVNSAHGGGTVLFPSVLEREGFIIAVSSKGRVPAYPPYLVEELDRMLDDKFDRMLDLMVEVRSCYSDKWDQKRRSEFYRNVLRDDIVSECVRSNNMTAAMERVKEMEGMQ